MVVQAVDHSLRGDLGGEGGGDDCLVGHVGSLKKLVFGYRCCKLLRASAVQVIGLLDEAVEKRITRHTRRDILRLFIECKLRRVCHAFMLVLCQRGVTLHCQVSSPKDTRHAARVCMRSILLHLLPGTGTWRDRSYLRW